MTPNVGAKTLLPSGSRPRGKRSLISLGRYDAVRYSSRGPAQNVDLYAVPVGTGAATIVCRGKLITYVAAEKRIRTAERHADAALRSLSALGYRVRK